ncbi:unnamed protein product, partial [Pelagomonas calceolata]
LPHDNSLFLVVRGPRLLHEIRLGARKVLGQVLEQRDRDFDVFFFFDVVGHVLVGHRRRFAPPPRRPRRGPVDDRRVARAVVEPALLELPHLRGVGFSPARRLSPPARRDDGRGGFRRHWCGWPRGRLRVQGRRARVVAPARAALCKSLRFRTRPRRHRALPRVWGPREAPLRGRDARGADEHGSLQSCWHVHGGQGWRVERRPELRRWRPECDNDASGCCLAVGQRCEPLARIARRNSFRVDSCRCVGLRFARDALGRGALAASH